MKYCLFVKSGLESSSLVKSVLGVLSYDQRFQKDENNPDLVIVIGGDGTFLKAAQSVFPKNEFAHFLCLNAGTIGFYHDFDESDINDIPAIVYKEKYLLGEIDVLEANDGRANYYAFNEFNLTGLSQNIDYDVKIDGQYLERFFGTGLIVSTVTGSTGYSRSLNGAIIDSNLHAMEITEIAGIYSKFHKSIKNSIIVASNRKISFENCSARKGFLFADGFKLTEETIDKLTISLSKKTLRCYIKNKDYFINRIHKTLDL